MVHKEGERVSNIVHIMCGMENNVTSSITHNCYHPGLNKVGMMASLQGQRKDSESGGWVDVWDYRYDTMESPRGESVGMLSQKILDFLGSMRTLLRHSGGHKIFGLI